MNGANETKGIILQEFNRRLIHLEECGSTKVNELEIVVTAHEKSIDRLIQLYEKGVLVVMILCFVGGANAIMTLTEFLRTFVR